MTKLNKQQKTWMFLLTFAAALFLLIGVVMIVMNTGYLQGSQYLASCLLSLVGVWAIYNNKIKVALAKGGQTFYLGFIFMTVGLSINIGLWAFGVLLFILGLLNKKK